MLKFHGLVDKHSAELADIIVRENGKNIVEALADVAKGNETVEWACSLPQLAPGRILEVEIRKTLIKLDVYHIQTGFQRHHMRRASCSSRSCSCNSSF